MNEGIVNVNDNAIEKILTSVDIEKYPEVFAEQLEILENANHAFEVAQDKEKKSKEKVQTVLQEVDALIDAANALRLEDAEVKKILGIIKYGQNKADIDKIKKVIKEILDHSSDNAVLQKKLIEVQVVLADTQMATLEVQKLELQYQYKVADATRLAFAFAAYNMSTSQSVLSNLTAIFEKASAEEMGELAQRQLLLVFDQIKNQENLITRMRENEERLKYLNIEIEAKDREIAELDEEQNRRIANNENALKEHGKLLYEQQEKDEEHDERLDQMDETDKRQDDLLQEHSQVLEEQEKKDDEFEKRFKEQDEEDAAQDKKIADNANKIDANKKTLEEQAERDKEIEQHLQGGLKSIEALKTDFDKLHKKVDVKITRLEEQMDDLGVVVAKNGWKIAVSVVAISSLLLNILQIIGII